PILSIRARLIVVALLAIAPLMVERVRGLERARVERGAVARTQVIDLARSGIAAQREVIESTRALLRAAARVYTKMPLGAQDCNQILSDLSSNVPWIRMLAMVGHSGQVKCGSNPAVIGGTTTARDYDGTQRILGFIRVPWTNARLAVGIDEAV